MGLDSKTRQPVPLSMAQLSILNIFKEIKPFLEKSSVPYYLLGGSLLGAVRHKGFIPWDDDIDIGIVRDDYERFLEMVSKNLPEHLELRSYRDESDHHYYFSRIVDTRYVLSREGSLVSRKENLWVDIFPLDGMPNNWLLRRIHMLRLLWVRFCYHVACFDKVNLKRPNRPLSERIIIAIVKNIHLGGHRDYKKWLVKLDKLLRKYKVQDSNWIVNFMGQYKFKEMFPKSYYGKGKLYTFEDMQLMGPEDYDKVLSQMYGDYMKEPEDCDKNVHDAYFDEPQIEMMHGRIA
ncbi:MAG: LicD family protein [Fibrobacter sp.]|nr:LicD family protein [Fibrobacter sp.]